MKLIPPNKAHGRKGSVMAWFSLIAAGGIITSSGAILGMRSYMGNRKLARLIRGLSYFHKG